MTYQQAYGADEVFHMDMGRSFGKRICLFFGIFIVAIMLPVVAAFSPMYSLNYGEAQVGERPYCSGLHH